MKFTFPLIQSSLLRCMDIHRIGSMKFSVIRLVLGNLLDRYMAAQSSAQQFGIHTYYLITNKNNRAWLFNYTRVYHPEEILVGGFSQIRDHTFVLHHIDWALVPSFMYPRNEDFSFLNLQEMFLWMSSYPHLLDNYGLRPVPWETQEPEYINVMKFFNNFE